VTSQVVPQKGRIQINRGDSRHRVLLKVRANSVWGRQVQMSRCGDLGVLGVVSWLSNANGDMGMTVLFVRLAV
jgi:hypothetical protein